ncbi:Platinum sensitivity protein [Mortierella sp. NVP85]|nr:Platinum sensitivity protein [Mortierella sp. NVP85]
MDPLAKMRVKVYKLNTGSQWIDQGTGHCSCEFNQDKSEGTLIVHSEEEQGKVLLRSQIRVGEDLYQRQQATLIVWSEDNGEDLALSFQEPDGCGEIWDNINEVQQHYTEDLFSDPSDPNGAGSSEFITLPDPELSNLADIDNLIKEAQNGANEKEKLAAFIIIDNYIDRLFPILEMCEDLDNRSDLHLLYGIMLGIIMLHDIAIMQYILKDDIIIGCLGMLEYDPELGDQKEDYREFLTKRAHFKQIVPINDPDMEQKIHQAYRLQFLRDTVLARVMDENLSSILSSLIFFLNFDILTFINQDPAFLRQLLGILEDESETMERKRDVIMFVQQFCAIAKTTQMATRVGVYRTLSQNGLFNVFEIALSDSNERIRMAGTEIFLSAMEQDPNIIRAYIVRQSGEEGSKQLLNIILDQFLKEEDTGIKLQYAEVIRILLDTNTIQNESLMPTTLDAMPNLDPDADKFLELFYGPYVGKFVSPLLELSEDATSFSRPVATLCENICQILSFMVRHHSFRSKYFVLSCGVVNKVCLLLRNRDQHIRLCALRFFRTCIGLKDEFYHRYLIKHSIFQHIVDTLFSTNNKNNLLNSACVEFFEYIREENIKSLISHIVPLYGERLKSIGYVSTFKGLVLRYEQQQDTSVADAEAVEAAASETSSMRRGPDQKAWTSSTVDDDEEAYFNNSDDEDEIQHEEKHEDDPPTSDRRRVRNESDEDSDQDEHEMAGPLDKDIEHVVASQMSPPPPPLRRKLVEYGEDEDEDEDEGAFSRRKPPEKKAKLDPEEAEHGDVHDQVMGETSDSEKSQGTIKFKLNNLRNGRSPSPLSPNSRSRSMSPLSSGSSLSPVSTRAGIAFIKAGSVESDSGQSSNGESSSFEGQDGVNQAAIHLRSDMARDFKRSASDEGQSEASPSNDQAGLTEHVAAQLVDTTTSSDTNTIASEGKTLDSRDNTEAE